MTRITYTDDKNQSHEVATLDDGLKFAVTGNSGILTVFQNGLIGSYIRYQLTAVNSIL